MPDAAPSRSRALTLAVVLVSLQGVVLVGIAAFSAVEIALGRADDAAVAGFVAGCALLAGVGLVLTGRGLAAGRRWSRAPALLPQLFAVPLSFTALGGEGRWVGVLLLVWGVVTAAAVLSPAVGRALTR